MCKKAKELRQSLDFELGAVLQDRPYTAVQVSAVWNGQAFWANGFSKVRYPDWWIPAMGVEIARGKAEAKIVRQILAQKRQINRAAFVEAFANQIAGEAVDATV